MQQLLLLTHCELIYSIKRQNLNKMIYNAFCHDESQFMIF